MTDEDRKYHRRKNVSTWMIIGVVVLIILLLVWLTIADIWGDTDVAAFIPPITVIEF